MISNKILFSFILILAYFQVSFGQTYKVMDVDCYDSNDNLFENAFGGGLNSPQFNEIDMNLDGTMDLLIFDREGSALIPMIYKDDKYVFSPEYRSLFPKFIKWVKIRDYNNDGVMDVFCFNLESPLNGVEIYKGSIENNSLKFEKYTKTPGTYEIIYYKFQNNDFNMEISSIDIPEIIDLDSDGDLDIVTFTGDESTVRYYQNMCVENNISLEDPTFELVDLCWGKFKESAFNESITLSDNPNMCAENFKPEFEIGNSRHAGSTITLYDDDSDGDYEAIIGDLTNSHIIWMNNGGDSDKAFMNEKDTIFPSYDKPAELYIFNSAFIFDVDKDGNTDLVVAPNTEGGASNLENVLYYRNQADNGQHDFSFVKNNLFADEMLEFGSLTNPAVCDFNQDGKKDILIGSFGEYRSGANPDANMILMENITDGGKLSYKIVNTDYLGFKNYNNSYFSYAPTFGDLDGDGDDDLLVGTQDGTLIYCENTAGPGNEYSFAAPVFDYAGIDIGDNAKPQLVDLNRDGLLDIVIGERNQNSNPFDEDLIGNINFFQNQGTSTVPEFNPDEDILPNTPTLGYVVTRVITESFNGSAAPFFYDTGDNFVLYTGSETGRMKLYNNIEGNLYGTFDLVDDEIEAFQEGKRNTVAIDDLNDDGILEFIIGNQRGGISIYGSNLGLDGIVGIEETLDVNPLNIYPNPTSGIFNVEGDLSKVSSISIYNQLGQRVFTTADIISTNEIIKLDLTHLQNGVYYLKSTDKNGSKNIQKIILHK